MEDVDIEVATFDRVGYKDIYLPVTVAERYTPGYDIYFS